ncbi:Branched-chain amino acid transport protein [Paucidesulfovibrio gracilis DSM 16080]|jgi:branched-subunit amino acid transport protein|uniref:Branched-chain amino acid transport protein n=1 Tax=Paucidesulfovibrio gracilis DSM 16080 TaxID=1121449 RepID=A0A1T4XT55_9BACT|nr:AzlD domain-containing protein [Paucidesulfovibrio gracilis]SKA92583.1 Branched-chain amino acid transport protein [Paucidesulfovibrio gracilis DSM 16080]
MDEQTLFLTIVGMALVTYIPRALPVLALSSRSLSPGLRRFLSYVPVAVLSALLVPSLLAPDAKLDVSGTNVFLWVSLILLPFCIRTRSFFGTVALGMGLVALARWGFGI